MSLIDYAFMQRFTNNLDTAIKDYVSSKMSEAQDKPTLKSATLAIGQTSVTFTDLPTTGTYLYDVYTSVAGLEYVSLDDSVAGSLTVNYEAQLMAVQVYLKIEGYNS